MAPQPASHLDTTHIVWIGDPASNPALPAGQAPPYRVTPATAEAGLALLHSNPRAADVLVLDASSRMLNVAGFLGECAAASVDLPVILLVSPDQYALGAAVAHLAVCDVVVKGPDVSSQLLASLAQVRARHDLLALFRGSRAAQDRLRTILEFQPAVTCAIGQDGVVAAMNLAGLALIGSGRDLVVGAPFTAWVPVDQRHEVAQLLRRACEGASGELDHDLQRVDGTVLPVRTRAVPLRSGDQVAVLATMFERAGAAELAGLRSERDGLVAEADTMRRAAVVSTNALRDAREELRSLQTERATWQERLDALEATLVSERLRLMTRMEAAAGERQRVEADLVAERARAATLGQALAAATAATATIEPLRDALAADRAELASLLDDLIRLAHQTEQRHAALAERHDAAALLPQTLPPASS